MASAAQVSDMGTHKKNYWFGYVLNVIRAYPMLKQEHDTLHEAQVVANYSQNGHGSGGINRKTEDIATKEMTGRKQREYDAVTKALEATMMMPSGSARCEVIRLVDWNRSHNLTGAALKLHYSEQTVKVWHKDFVHLVASYMGMKD